MTRKRKRQKNNEGNASRALSSIRVMSCHVMSSCLVVSDWSSHVILSGRVSLLSYRVVKLLSYQGVKRLSYQGLKLVALELNHLITESLENLSCYQLIMSLSAQGLKLSGY